jgi:two-component system response regulator DesR
MSTPIRVVLAEDQTMVLGALSALLELEPDISVVACAANGRDALDAVSRLSPNVLVTDIEMPIMTGLELAANLRTSHPAVRTIILTTFARPYLRRAMDAGARGYLLKDRHLKELAEAGARHAVSPVVDPRPAHRGLEPKPDPHGPREADPCKRAAEGPAAAPIAAELHLLQKALNNYLSGFITPDRASTASMPPAYDPAPG